MLLLLLLIFPIFSKSISRGVQLASWDYAHRKASSSQQSGLTSRNVVINWGSTDQKTEKTVALSYPIPKKVYVNSDDIDNKPSNICAYEIVDGHIRVSPVGETTINLC